MEINFAEMFSTTGSILFYGGIIGGAVSLLLIILFFPFFSVAKKEMNRKIEEEFEKE